jgi:hypothetical protein
MYYKTVFVKSHTHYSVTHHPGTPIRVNKLPRPLPNNKNMFTQKVMFISSEYFQHTVHRYQGIGLDLDQPQGTAWVDIQTGLGIACQKVFDLVPRKKLAIYVITWSNFILPGV